MRHTLILLIVLLSLQVASAQENTHSIITVENAQYLTPLYTINEEFFMASFSQFEHDGTAVLLVESEYSDEEPPMESTIRTWDLETQAITNTISFETFGGVYGPMQMPVYGKIATISVGGNIDILTYPDGNVHSQFNSTSFYYTIAAISPDGRRLVFTQCIWRENLQLGCYPETWFFMILATNSMEFVSTIDIQLEQYDIRNNYSVNALALSETGRYLLIEATTELNIFDTSTRERVLLDEDNCRVHHATFISETRILAVRQSCVDMSPPSIVEWDFQTGEERSIFPFSDGEIKEIQLNPDRTVLGVLTSSGLYLVNFSTGEILKEIEATTFNFDFSPDGHYLLHGHIIYGLEN